MEKYNYKEIPILIVDDEKDAVKLFCMNYEDKFTFLKAYSPEEALEIMEKEYVGVILSDIKMGSKEMDGLGLVEKIYDKWPDTIRIILSAYSKSDYHLRAINKGHAWNYIEKSEIVGKKEYVENLLSDAVKRILIAKEEKRELEKTKKDNIKNQEIIESLKEGKESVDFIYKSESFGELLDLCNNIVDLDVKILITGETGTGKTALANYIHNKSKRKNNLYKDLNIAAIQENMLPTSLFGYIKGAFTGALNKDKKGVFEITDKGTLLIDEIGDLSLDLQKLLLQVLQNNQVYRVGDTETAIDVDVRLICATHQNLSAMVDQKKFREDLFHRINGIQIEIPPLRGRKEDIIPLFKHFLWKKYKNRFITDNECLEFLLKYNWPGNVRELMYITERIATTAFLLSKSSNSDPIIDLKTVYAVLDPLIKSSTNLDNLWSGKSRSIESIDYEHPCLKDPKCNEDMRKERLKEYIIYKEALEECKGIKLRAAKLLGVKASTFTYRAREIHGMDV